jgi:hypothetical protein
MEFSLRGAVSVSNHQTNLRNFRQHKLAIAVAIPLLTTGCLYDSDNNPDGLNGSATNSSGVSGVAIDGYLRSAKACLDRNLNMICDAGEESGITNDQGRFNLNISTADAAAFPVVVEALAGLTVDMDRPGERISQSYSMSAPAGQHEIVNPLTSLVESLRTSGKTKTQAEQQIIAELGVPSVDMLYEDFIAKDDAQSKKLHSMGQVIVQLLTSTLEARSNLSDNADRAVVNSLGLRKMATSQLAAIKLAVDGGVQADGSLTAQQLQQVSTDLFNDNRNDLVVSDLELAAEKEKPGSVANPNLPAPVLVAISDAIDQLSWNWVAGLASATDYEYSVDGGASWQAATVNPLILPDAPIAKSDLQLRVAGDVSLKRLAGGILIIDQAFTKRPDAPVAPLTPVVDDAFNTFSWENVSGFDQAIDYEYSVDSGVTWQQVTANPQAVPDINIAIGAVRVRVVADLLTGRPAGEGLNSAAAYTKTPAPAAAPSQLSVDDASNHFSWAYSPASDDLADYEFSIDGGSSWTTANGNPQSVNDIAIPVGQLQLRLKQRASDGRPASVVISSTRVFSVTPLAPSAPTSAMVNDALNLFGWVNVAGFDAPNSYEYSDDGGLNWQVVAANPQLLADVAHAVGDVVVRVAADPLTGRAAGGSLSSNQAFTVTPARPDAPTSAVHNDAQNTFGWSNVSGFNEASGYEFSTDGGASWQVVSANPQVIADNDFAVATVQVRVRANSLNGRVASPALVSSEAYTVTPAKADAPTTAIVDDALNTFDWMNVVGFDELASYEYSLDSGSSWQSVSEKPQAVPDQDYAIGAVRVRVVADNQSGRLAGAQLNSDRAYSVTPLKPAAPSAAAVDDLANTFGWKWVDGYTAVAEYEFSTDNAVTWSQVIANPQPVGDSDIAIGHVQVRVKSDVLTGRPLGDVLISDAEYTVTPGAPDAPTSFIVDDNLNQFGWTSTAGFSAVSDYEYSLDSGVSWQVASANPQSLSDADLPSGSVWLRVVADVDAGRPAGTPLKSSAAFSLTPLAPAAPTAPVVDDAANTFAWTMVSGFGVATQYEYSINAGSSWQAVSANPQQLDDNAFALGAVQVRVAADTSNARPAGAALQSNAQYTSTPAAPQAPTNGIVNNALNTFSWAPVSGFDAPSDYQYSVDSGVSWQSVSANPQMLVDQDYATGEVRVRVAADQQNGREAGAQLQSTSPYTVTPEQPVAPTASVHNDAQNTFAWTVVSGYQQASAYEVSLDGGVSWNNVSANPQSIPDLAYGVGVVRVRVAAGADDARPAGRVLLSTKAYTVTPNKPLAPTAAVQDDAANTFGWTNVATFSDVSDYQYSKNSGVSWEDVTTNPIDVGDLDLASGVLQVRVVADTETGRPAGAILASVNAYTVTPVSPVAPTAAVQDDLANTFGWTAVAGFAAPSDYEISKDSGSNWNAVTANPEIVGDGAIAIAAVQVRVAADSANGRPAGAALSSTAAYTQTPAAPIAPTAGVVDDSANTFDWQSVSGFAQASDYQYSKDSGANWLPVSVKPIAVGDVSIASGALQVRVIADAQTGRPAGAALLSNAAFTGTSSSATKEQATITGTHFAKLNGNGDYVSASTTMSEGWRCVQDLSAGNKVVWALLKNGELNGEDNLLWPDVPGYVASLNSDSTCGYNDWVVPALSDLKTLRTVEIDSKKTLDTNVFPNHKADSDTLPWDGGYSAEKRVFYWSSSVYDYYGTLKQYAFAYYKPAGVNEYLNEYETSFKQDSSEAGKPLMIRAVRQDLRFVKLDVTGAQLPADSSNWVCLQDNRAESPFFWLKNSETSGDMAYDDALAKIAENNVAKTCGFNDWKLPKVSDIEPLLLSGEWGSEPWAVSSYDYTWTSNAGDDDTEAMTVSGSGSIYSRSKTSNYLLNAVRKKLDPDAAVASISSVLQALQAKGVTFASDAQASTADFNVAKNAYDGAVSGADVAIYDTAKNTITTQQLLIDPRYLTLQQDYVALELRVNVARATQSSIANNADGNFSAAQIQQAASEVSQINSVWTTLSGQRNSVFDHKTDVANYLERFQQVYQVLNGATGAGGIVAVKSLIVDIQSLQGQLEAAIVEANAAQAAVDALAGAQDDAVAQRAVAAAKAAFAKVEAIRLKLLALSEALQALQVAINGLEVNVSAAVEALANTVTNAAEAAKSNVTPVQQTGSAEGAESYEKAREAGWSVNESEATVDGTSFAKLDIKGRLLPADTAFNEGWRCVRDVRQSTAQLTWAILEDGAKAGINDLSWDIGDPSVSDVQGVIARYNNESICGYDNWQVPMQHYLKSLETGTVANRYGTIKDTLDINVFVNHKGFEAEFNGGGYSDPRYWYWSRDDYNSSENYVYSYASSESSYTTDNQPTGSNVVKDEVVILRPMRINKRFEMVDSSGVATTNEAQWVCTREITTGAFWTRQSGDSAIAISSLIYADALALVAAQNSAALCGRTNWGVPSIVQLAVLAPLESKLLSDVQDSQYWSSDDNGSGYFGNNNKCYDFDDFVESTSSCTIDGTYPDTNYLRLISTGS